MGIDRNLGTRRIPPLAVAKFPSVDAAVAARAAARMRESKLDILLVNPLHHANSSSLADWGMRRSGTVIHLLQNYTIF